MPDKIPQKKIDLFAIGVQKNGRASKRGIIHVSSKQLIMSERANSYALGATHVFQNQTRV